ncbi:hypothetical protein [Streptomyces mirabilis]|uniref:hypothetical protein n=1 Tax=Streptomyces mirabilis TaxID=68239 RepID=UPI002E27D1C4|nr:hypothetical protein [Streptomyces mirabilis]
MARAVEAAARAAEETDPDAGSELYERAAGLADDHDETARLLYLAAVCRQRAGAFEHVQMLLGKAMALARAPGLRRELAVLQARRPGAGGHPRTAHRVLRDAAGRLTGEPDRAARLLLEAVDSAVHAADSRAALGSAWQAYRLTRLCGGDLAEAAAVHLAQVLALRGERGQARELLLGQTAGEAARALVGRAEVLGWLEEYEAACVLLDRVLGDQPPPLGGAEGGANPSQRAAALGCRAWIRLWTGDWHGARAGRTVACARVLGDLVQEEFEAERSVSAAALLPDEFDEPYPGVGVGFAYRGGQGVHQDVGHIGDHIGTAHRDHPLCLPGASPATPADHLRG